MGIELDGEQYYHSVAWETVLVGLRTCTESCMVQIIQSLYTNVVPDKYTKSLIKQIYIRVLSGVGRSPTSGTTHARYAQHSVKVCGFFFFLTYRICFRKQPTGFA